MATNLMSHRENKILSNTSNNFSVSRTTNRDSFFYNSKTLSSENNITIRKDKKHSYIVYFLKENISH